MEKIFAADKLSKRQRVEYTLAHQAVDRCAMLEQLSYNPGVIADWTGKNIQGFDFTLDDVCEVCRKTMDIVMPPGVSKHGKRRVTSPDGFVYQYDDWTAWCVARPFNDEEGAKKWLLESLRKRREARWDAGEEREKYRKYLADLQGRLGETLLLAYPVTTGLCAIYSDGAMGLEIFTYFFEAYPELVREHMDLFMEHSLRRLHAIADLYRDYSPVVLVAEDFATKQGPIFPPSFLNEFHYPNVKKLADAWHEHGLKAIYHSDGNWKKVIPELIACNVDGFYCLEPNCGMNIVELKNRWPKMVWAGGVDGVDLMERGTPEQVKAEVRRHIRETNALRAGGMLVASSSEINPPIKPENFRAMVEAVGEMTNAEYR